MFFYHLLLIDLFKITACAITIVNQLRALRAFCGLMEIHNKFQRLRLKFLIF
jgi:hypothetical protein